MPSKISDTLKTVLYVPYPQPNFVSLTNDQILMRNFLFSLLIILISNANLFGKNSEIIPDLLLDTLDNRIEINYDENGMPREYSCDVFTPVCLVGQCLPIRIILYWDLAGNYQKFQLPNGEILTKTEHAPFTPQDYLLLQSILRNPSSELKRYTLEELTGNIDNHEKVDGVSGATITGLRGHYVPEALYSSHRLWHLANGAITEKLREYTALNLFTKYPINYFLNSSISNCRKEALAYHCRIENRSFNSVFKTIIDTSDSELTRTLIQIASPSTLTDESIKSSLSDYYLRTKMEQNRLAILTRWSEIQLDSVEIIALSSLLGKHLNQFNIEIELISTQTKWPELSYYHLATFIKNERNLLKKERVLKLLHSRQVNFSSPFHKEFKRLIKEEKLQEFIAG